MDRNLHMSSFFKGPFWETTGRTALYLLAFLLPLWALPITVAPLGLNKVFLAYVLILVAFVAWLVGRIQTGVVILPKNYLALALVLLASIWGISGIFSISRYTSFLALATDPSSVIAIVLFVLASFLASFYLRTTRHVFTWLLALFASASLVFLVQGARVLFSLNVVPWIDLPFSTSNLFGSWIEFGIFFSLVAFVALFLFEVVQIKSLRLSFLVMSLAAFVVMLAVNVGIIWWTFFTFLLILLAYLFSLRFTSRHLLRPTFLMILVVLFVILAPASASLFTSFLGTQTVEIRPSWTASWAVTQSALAENVALGSGPATFLYDWIRFKPIEVNQGSFWNVRFASGAAFFPSVVATTGLAGTAAFLFLIATFFFYGFKALVRLDRAKLDSFLVLVFFASTFLLTYLFFYNPGFVLTLFFFLFLGMFLGMLSGHGLAEEKTIKLFSHSGAGFVSALLIIFLLVGVASSAYFLSEKYVAAYFFGKGVRLFNIARDVEGAEAYVNRAIRFEKRDEYYRGAVDIKLARITNLLQEKGLAPEELQGRFENLLGEAIGHAQEASRINPIDPLNWLALAQVYEAIIPFQIAGVSDFALSAYQKAAEKNPTSPEPYLAQARINLSQGERKEAKAHLEEALKLKPNYTPAHLLLAQMEDQAGNVSEAIERVKQAALLSPNDIGVLFQLGLLYYRRDQLDNARQVFERAVSLNPNYSNARYFLGLIYDRLGDKELATQQFERIQVFNPENREVTRIIANLKSDKRALDGISPPAPEPEEREEAPVED